MGLARRMVGAGSPAGPGGPSFKIGNNVILIRFFYAKKRQVNRKNDSPVGPVAPVCPSDPLGPKFQI